MPRKLMMLTYNDGYYGLINGNLCFIGNSNNLIYAGQCHPMKPPPKRKRLSQSQKRKLGTKLLETIIGVSGVVIALILTFESKPAVEFARNSFSPFQISGAKPDCSIKGNISISSGKKLYHLPGMEDYESTNIEAVHGEKWFCTEAEAISKGWVKAPK